MKKKLSYWTKETRAANPSRGIPYMLVPDTDAKIFQVNTIDVLDDGEPLVIEADDDTKGEDAPDTDDKGVLLQYIKGKPKKPKKP